MISLAVFVAAVADQLQQIARFKENRLDHCLILGVEHKVEHPGIVGEVLGDAEPRADDDAGDRRAGEDVADADIGNARVVPVGDFGSAPRAILNRVQPPHVSIMFMYFRSERY